MKVEYSSLGWIPLRSVGKGVVGGSRKNWVVRDGDDCDDQTVKKLLIFIN
jgi:hypothetical protein